MKILFYVEPTVLNEDPYFNKNWVQAHFRLFATLKSARPDAEGLVLLGEHLLAELEGEWPATLGKRAISAAEIIDCFGRTADLVRPAYRDSLPAAASEKFAALLRSKIGDFKPDVVIVFDTPAPILRRVLPDTPILHQEVGLFSRPPYPLTYFFDPFGQQNGSAIARFAPWLLSLAPSPEDTRLLNGLRAAFIDGVISPRNPFKEIVGPLRSKYRGLVLFALHGANFSDFREELGFESQLDFLRAALLKVPSDVGVLVTQHPTYKVFHRDVATMLRREFPNLIHDPSFERWYGASQFLLEYSDMVVTAFSSVGLQALFWRKPLVALGDSSVAALAHGRSLDDIPRLLGGAPAPSRDAALAHLLRHYYVPQRLLTQGPWLASFLERIVARAKDARPLDATLWGAHESDAELLANTVASTITKDVPAYAEESDIVPAIYGRLCLFEEYLRQTEAISERRRLEGLAALEGELREELSRLREDNSRLSASAEQLAAERDRIVQSPTYRFAETLAAWSRRWRLPGRSR